MRKADKLATFMCRLSENPGSLNLLEPSGPVWACTGINLPVHTNSYTAHHTTLQGLASFRIERYTFGICMHVTVHMHGKQKHIKEFLTMNMSAA